MTQCNPAVYIDKDKSHVSRRYPYLHTVNHQIPVPGRVGEEKGGYGSSRADSVSFSAGLRDVRVERLRRVADAQIGSLLRLACLLDTPGTVSPGQEDLRECAASIRAATTSLEDALHPIADMAAGREQEV